MATKTDETPEGWDEEVGESRASLPKPGTKVWYRMGDWEYNYEWRPAMVVDNAEGHPGTEGKPIVFLEPNPGTIHLKMRVVPATHHSADVWAYRLNRSEGTEPGQWAHERPANAAAEFKKVAEKRKQTAEYNRERMSETARATRGR